MHSRSDYILIIALIPGNEKPFGVILFIIISQIFDRIRMLQTFGYAWCANSIYRSFYLHSCGFRFCFELFTLKSRYSFKFFPPSRFQAKKYGKETYSIYTWKRPCRISLFLNLVCPLRHSQYKQRSYLYNISRLLDCQQVFNILRLQYYYLNPFF